MQNKGFVITFAVLLTLICCFYLSFSFVTRHYENKAVEYAKGDLNVQSQYLDSIANEKVWLGYTLKQAREKAIGLGLDLKGGMHVVLEVDAAEVLKTLANQEDPKFNQALKEASDANVKGSSKDFISLFIEKYEAINQPGTLASVFAAKMKDKLSPTDDNTKVKLVLTQELEGVANNSFNVLRTRIDRFGVVAPNIQKLDRAERILIELPGIKEPERVKKLLQGSANLEFWRTFNLSEIQDKLGEINAQSAELLLATVADSTSKHDTLSRSVASVNHLKFNKTLFEYINNQFGNPQGSIIALVNKADTAAINAILEKTSSDLKFAWGFKAVDPKETMFELYALKASGRKTGNKRGPALDGSVITSASSETHNAQHSVSMTMSNDGARDWATLTGAEQGRSIAIVLDGYVYSAPRVNDRIEGGNSSISGNFSREEATDLANVLNSGKMKVSVRVVQEDIIGSSLGDEAIRAGIISFIVALIVLMAYMCLVYGFIPGMIANGALLFNLFFTLGILASINAVLTLPGIAGLVLALAMAVDANVLIYERTKEELRAGNNVKTAVTNGYKHAFSAIFDSNLTSIITGLILYNFGTGAIKGFAITEIIGIAASFFTAIFMTRLVYEWAFSKGKLHNLTFTTKPIRNFLMDTKINFLGMHRKAYAVSLVVIVLGIVSLFTLKLNQGIDFTGGRNYVIRFDQAVNTEDLTNDLKSVFQQADEDATVSVITIGSSNQVRVSTNYRIQEGDDTVDTDIKSKFNEALGKYMGSDKNIDSYILSVERVGPSVADDMKVSAIKAVVFAIICMGLYILIRFRDVAFSIGTIVAVAHDAAIVIFAYSFFHKIMPFSLEIDQTFIAAILTVVGFSIHDKVVIFDRVRERTRDFPTNSIANNINDSLNTTLTRTVSTSLSTILVLICIFVLGGDSIRSFTFAMLLGIILGTYSSVFIATPLAYEMLHRKEKRTSKLSTSRK